MKYPFWVLKSDALRLLKGKWKPLVVSLFLPFLAYCAFLVKKLLMETSMTNPVLSMELIFQFDVATVAFTLITEIITLGIYHNLHESKEKASFFDVYAFGFRYSWKLLPALGLWFILPTAVNMLMSYGNLAWFYDYLFFSLMSYEGYYLLLSILSLVVQIVGLYFQYALLLAPCILADHPEYGAFQIVKESFRLSRGNKMYLFLLGFSFMGWVLLGSLAVIGVLWAMLYMLGARYAYYRRLSRPVETVVELNQML